MKKNVWKSKSLLTFLSILSVILGFSLLCGLVMGLLFHFGVVELPASGREEPYPTPENEKIELPYHDKNELHLYTGEKESFDVIMPLMPFADSFYIKVKVMSDGKQAFPAGEYEIWKYGDKYRIHHYTADGEVITMQICNGKEVQTTNFSTASIEKHAYTEKDSFAAVSPLTDFKKDFEREHHFYGVREYDDLILLYCEYPEDGRTDEISFSKTTGLVYHYDRRINETSVFSMDIRTVDLQFGFDDYMFAFD